MKKKALSQSMFELEEGDYIILGGSEEGLNYNIFYKKKKLHDVTAIVRNKIIEDNKKYFDKLVRKIE